MSLPVYPGFSGPVTSVPIVGNPMTMKGVIDATRKSNAGPVVKKSALISRQPIPGARKPPDGANNVIGTFLETPVSKCISSRIRPANLQPTYSPPSVLNVVAVQPVVNRTSD